MVRPKVEELGPKMRLKKGEKRNRKKMATVFTIYTMNPTPECAPDPIERKVYAYLGTKKAAFEVFRAEASEVMAGTRPSSSRTGIMTWPNCKPSSSLMPSPAWIGCTSWNTCGRRRMSSTPRAARRHERG
ncbi:hypothetical protein D3C87_1632720 [compost metagenome]